MSTRALNEIVRRAKRRGWSGSSAAWRELEAIKKAAKVLTECDMDLFPRGTLTPEDAQGAMDVLLAIAKEAP